MSEKQTCNFCRCSGIPDDMPHLIHYRTYCGVSFWTCTKCHKDMMIRLNRARRDTVENFVRDSLEAHNKAPKVEKTLPLHDKLESLIRVSADNAGVENITPSEISIGISKVELLVRETLKKHGTVPGRYLGFLALSAMHHIMYLRAQYNAELEKLDMEKQKEMTQ